MKIGELSQQSGLSIDTIRFYEKQGLLPPPRRTAANYRHYDPETVRRLVFIRRARDLGFTLHEIAELLALSEHQEADAGAVRDAARAKVEDLERRIHDLQEMRRALERLVRACSGHGPRSHCPILDALTEP